MNIFPLLLLVVLYYFYHFHIITIIIVIIIIITIIINDHYSYCCNCVNNKMLEYDWFLTAHIYSLILLCNSKTVRFDLSDYQKLVIGQVKSDS